MSAGRIIWPKWMPARDRQGEPISGALFYVYQNRTTTLASIYTNRSLTTAATNPVVANSAGQFPEFFAEGGTVEEPVLYTYAVTTSTGESPGAYSTADDYQPSIAVDFVSSSTLDSYSDLAALDITFADSVVSVLEPLRGGTFFLDASDTTALADGGTVSVDSAGRRWKRQFDAIISPEWFGAKGDGVTDDTVALNLALASPSALKHEVVGGGVYRVTSGHLIIPEAVTFRLNSAFGEDATGYTPWDRPCIRTSSAYEVQVYNSATFDGAVIRYGLTKAATYSEAMANIAAFAGVGIRIMGEDTTVRAFVMGYGTGYSSAGRESCDVYLEHDCTNGAYIYGSLDEGEVTVRGTPYYTVHQFVQHDVTRRQGVNCWIESCDGIRVKDVYDYGWDVGLRLTACAAGTVIEKWQTEAFLDVVCGNIGLLTEGLMTNVKILAGHSDGHNQNIVFNHSGTIQLGTTDVSAARTDHIFVATYAGVQGGILAVANASPNMVKFDAGARSNVFSMDQVLFHRGSPAQNGFIFDPVQASLGLIKIGVVSRGDDAVGLIDNWTNAARIKTPAYGFLASDRIGPATNAPYLASQSFAASVDAVSYKSSVALNMDERGLESGAGNSYVINAFAGVPAGPAYTEPLGPGPGYNTGAWKQNTLKAGVIVTGEQRRESYYIANRGDGRVGLVFNDLVLLQGTGQLWGTTYGRLYGMQINCTLPSGADGQVIGAEIEVFNGSSNVASYTAPNQKVGIQVAAIGNFGEPHYGLTTKGLTFGARDYGRYQAMIYTDPSYVIDSFMRIEGAFSIKHQTLDQVILAWNTMTPRDASDLYIQVVKPTQIYDLLQVGDVSGPSQIFTICQSIDPSKQFNRSYGVDMRSGEWRLANVEGLNPTGTGNVKSAAFDVDRWGFGDSPQVAGGKNLLYLKNGTAPTAGQPGIADGGAFVVINGALWYKGGLGTFTQLAPA